MGQLFQFICLNCEYVCEVSGGEHSGKLGHRTRTFVCKDCELVQDLLIGKNQAVEGKPIAIPVQIPFQKFISKFTGNKKINEQKLRYKEYWEKVENSFIPESNIFCKNCKGENIETWDKSCPKCKTKMKPTRLTAIWD